MIFDCVICSELLTIEDDVYGTRCGHIFHKQCLVEWLRKSETCPHCRTQTFQNDIQKLFFNDSAGHSDNIRAVKDENQDLTNTVQTLKEDLENDKRVIQDLRAEVERLKAELEDLQVRLAESETNHAQVVSELFKSRQELEDATVIHSSIADELDREKKSYITEIAALQSSNLHLKQENQQLELDFKRERENLTERVNVLTDENKVILEQVNGLSIVKISLMEKIVKYTDKISSLQEHINDRQQGMNDLQERINFLDNENARFSKNIEIVKTENQQLFEQVKNLETERLSYFQGLTDLQKQKAELAAQVIHLEAENKKLRENFGKKVVVPPEELPEEIREPENIGEQSIEQAESVPEGNTGLEDKVVVPKQEISAGEESLIQFDVERKNETTSLKPSPEKRKSDNSEEYGSSTDFELVTSSSCTSSPESNSSACNDSVIVLESSTETKDLLEA